MNWQDQYRKAVRSDTKRATWGVFFYDSPASRLVPGAISYTRAALPNGRRERIQRSAGIRSVKSALALATQPDEGEEAP